MTPQEFCYWCQGFFEIADPKMITEEQTEMIKKHLNLVFFHAIDPSYSDDPKVQAEMQDIHDGKKKELTNPYPEMQFDPHIDLVRC